MKLQRIATLVAVWGAVCAQAGTIELQGKATVSEKPELAVIQVDIRSMCYETAADAKKVNDDLASTMLETLKKFVKSSEDTVTATGGQYQQRSEVIEVHDELKTTTKTLCTNKWSMSNRLVLRTSALTELDKLQDALISNYDNRGKAKENDKMRVTASISAPRFTVTEKTMLRMRKDGQKRAFSDAKDQFENLKAEANFINAKLKSITQFGGHFEAPAVGFARAQGATPTIPDELTVTFTFNVVWEFETKN